MAEDHADLSTGIIRTRITVAGMRAIGDGMTVEELTKTFLTAINDANDTVTQIAELFHEAIENTVIAEDEYPHLREKLHRAIDAERERLRGK